MIKLYFITLPIFFVIDMLWLGIIAKDFYRNQIGFLMADKVNWVAAIIFYLIFIAGLVFFVISPALEKNSLSYAITVGAFFGFVTYATYDLTNLAITKNWPLLVTVVDLAWGTVLGCLVSTLAYLIVKKLS
jgi:uncharacterized membrane protein